jgi:NIMA (never in mitosis gene a)-related kinase
LDDGFYLLNNVVVPPNWGDTDHVVVGPNGLFVVETKTVGDMVECDGDSWARYKVGAKGFSYPVALGNPSAQAKRNAKSLKDLLLTHKSEIFEGESPHIWVHAVVVFTNEDVKLKIKNTTVEVLRLPELADFILSTKSGVTYAEEELKRMVDIIIKECH